MNGLEERLTNDLSALADAAEFRPEGAAAIAGDARMRRQRRRVGRTVLVAAVVLAVGGFAARVLVDDDPVSTGPGDDPNPTVTIAPTTTAPPQTTERPTETTSSTTVAPPGNDRLALTGAGLGRVDFGDDYDSVVAAVTAELGEPDSVSEIYPMPPDCLNGFCDRPEWAECTDGTYAVEQLVQWPGMSLIFRGQDADSRVLRWWGTSDGSRLATPEGLRASDPPEAWAQAYGDRISFEDAEGIEGEPFQRMTLDLDGEVVGWFYADPDMGSVSAGINCNSND